MIKSKLDTLMKAIHGVLMKCRFVFFNIKSIEHIAKTENCSESVTISLTSYGRRVSSTLPYVLISLLRQTRKPNRIVVWLDNSWNDDNIPTKIKKFKNVGVEVKYCEDYKSFKKLIPSLIEYPTDTIITCDDDLYYSKYMVERLLSAHKEYPNTICCQLAHGVKSMNGKILPYSQWEEEIYDNGKFVFPLGGSGCLYKKEFLYEDAVNYGLAQTLSPKADDVWFYFMGLKNKTGRYVLPYIKDIYVPLDAFYQYFHRGSSLMDDNLAQGYNDKQIEAVMNYYSIKMEDII